MKAVVTGGAGFIGSHLVDALVANGFEVHVIDNLSTGQFAYVNPRAEFHQADITETLLIDQILNIKPDILFHLAAQVDALRSTYDPVHDASVNIVGTVNVLHACRHACVRKIVYASSPAIYGCHIQGLVREDSTTDPTSHYGISKFSAESYIRLFHDAFGLTYTILRYSNVYGARQSPYAEGSVIAVFMDRMMKGMPLIIHGDGQQSRDFLYVKDAVKANIAAINKGDNQTIHVSTAKRTTINELVRLLESIHRSKVETLKVTERAHDISSLCLDNKKAQSLLNWRPQYTLKHGLREMCLTTDYKYR